MFPHRFISRFRDLNWPPRSPDFSASDYFLWDYLKSRVFEKRTATLDELKVSIREAIQRVMDGFTKRLQERFTAEGAHSLHSVFKMRTVYVSHLISKISVVC
jgi:hypothetical protein